MTNSEAIECINKSEYFTDGVMENAIKALQENDKLKAEIEQLKSELEKSIKLPCKIGDIVYREIIQHDSYDDSEYKVISACNFRFDMIDKIGKTIFLIREEAEQHLKGKVEE